MENKDTKAIDGNSGQVSPDSISKFNKEMNLIKKMDQDICEITERIKEKMPKKYYLNSSLNHLNNSYGERRNREAENEKL
ncbi:hypothetical protein P8452_57767 [Trifolium repens]|nr:hypothetical protein P8452_57767 [Trifolium repens]